MPKPDPIDYALSYGPRCRDCADSDGVCPHEGTPCDADVARSVVKRALDAWRHGLANGFIDDPLGRTIENIRVEARNAALVEAAKIADGWVEAFGSQEIENVSAKVFASGAVKDVADGIRNLASSVGDGRPFGTVDEIKCSVGTMTTSAGKDYFVVLRNGDREITPDSHPVLGRAQYDCEHWKWFFGQAEEEPDILAFDTDIA